MYIRRQWSQKPVFYAVGLLPLLVFAMTSRADLIEPAASGAIDQPQIGLALSGGGARGAAHIGVLRLIEELGISIDCIAGTSMGAIVGALYASGYDSDQIEAILSEMDWRDALQDRSERLDRYFLRKRDDFEFLVKAKPGINQRRLQTPLGVIQGQQLELLLRRKVVHVNHIEDFNKLSIPYLAVATDFVTGEAVALRGGDLATAMRASMSVPGIFEPIKFSGRLLVDGGLSRNIPISNVKALCADIVIAVDVSTPLQTQEEIQNLVDVSAQVSTIMTNRNALEELALLTDRDILIKPDLRFLGATSFGQMPEAIPAGYLAAELERARLANLAVGKQRQLHSVETKPLLVSKVQFSHDTTLTDDVFSSRLGVNEGDVFQSSVVDKGINQIYGLELFESVNYDLLPDNDGWILEVSAKEKRWGPNYLQLDLSLREEFSGTSSFGLEAAFLQTRVNDLAGERRLKLAVGRTPGVQFRWYQPLEPTLSWYFEYQMGFERDRFREFVNDDAISQLRSDRTQLNSTIGYLYQNWSDLSLTVSRTRHEFETLIGSDRLDTEKIDNASIDLSWTVDSFDNVRFPQHGVYAEVKSRHFRKGIGSEKNADQYAIEASYAKTFGRNTYLLSTEWGFSKRDEANFVQQYRLGGFRRLSGLAKDQLAGNHFFISSLTFYHRLGNVTYLPMYVGASIELGNTFTNDSDISFSRATTAGSIFFGADTFLGPVYLAYGRAEGEIDTAYIVLGSTR